MPAEPYEAWPETVYDTHEWRRAWSRSTVERLRTSPDDELPFYLMEHSPFWTGYEIDAEMEPIWDRPTVVLASVYAGYGPAYLSAERDQVVGALGRGLELVEEWKAPGLLALNLPAEAASVWESVRVPDVRVRFDSAYFKRIGEQPDGVLGDIGSHERTEWRRRWRRSSEQGLRLVEESAPSDRRINEVLELTNGSALRHGWPVLYDRLTFRELLEVPGTRLMRADWSGRTVGGFLAFEHERRLYLWAGGIDPDVLRQVSPYLFMLYEILSTGADRGWDVIEFGKGNDEFKRRHGFQATELWSLWYADTPEDAAVYGPRLLTLHERLTAVQAPR